MGRNAFFEIRNPRRLSLSHICRRREKKCLRFFFLLQLFFRFLGTTWVAQSRVKSDILRFFFAKMHFFGEMARREEKEIRELKCSVFQPIILPSFSHHEIFPAQKKTLNTAHSNWPKSNIFIVGQLIKCARHVFQKAYETIQSLVFCALTKHTFTCFTRRTEMGRPREPLMFSLLSTLNSRKHSRLLFFSLFSTEREKKIAKRASLLLLSRRLPNKPRVLFLL